MFSLKCTLVISFSIGQSQYHIVSTILNLEHKNGWWPWIGECLGINHKGIYIDLFRHTVCLINATNVAGRQENSRSWSHVLQIRINKD